MTRPILAFAVVLALAEFAPARAQYVLGPSGFGFSSGYSYGRGFGLGFSFGGPRLKVKGFVGGFGTQSAYFGPVVFGPPVFLPPPAFGPPYGNGWGWGPPVVAVPVPVVVPVPVPVPVDDERPAPKPREPAPALRPPGDFLVISPQKDPLPDRVLRPGEVRPPAPAPVGVDPMRAAVVGADKPEADPKKEATRLVRLARAAFAAGEFGRAAELFERAADADPTDARIVFWIAHARFATGEYGASVARIREGLELDPRWPAVAFDPAELYGDRPERYLAHLDALKKAVADNPGVAVLEFLLGYQLWFKGDRDEARRLFRAAEKRLARPGPIALFK